MHTQRTTLYYGLLCKYNILPITEYFIILHKELFELEVMRYNTGSAHNTGGALDRPYNVIIYIYIYIYKRDISKHFYLLHKRSYYHQDGCDPV